MPKEIGGSFKEFRWIAIVFTTCDFLSNWIIFSVHVKVSFLLKHADRTSQMVGGFEQNVRVQDTWKWECIRCTVKREALKTEEEGWAGGEIFKTKFAWVRPSCHAVLVWIPCFPESGVLASRLLARLELGEERSWALTALQARLICEAPVFVTNRRGCFLSSYRGLTDYIKRQFQLNSGTSTKKVPVSDNQPQLILSAQVGLFFFSFF